VPLTKNVIDMCEKHGIEPHTLMREAANPLSEYVSVIHSSYTPSWEYAMGGMEESDAPEEAAAAETPSSLPARSRPRKRKPKPVPRSRPEMEEPESSEAEPDPWLDEAVRALQSKRAEADRRLAAVRLGEQRRHEQSNQRELQDEVQRNRSERVVLERQQKLCDKAKRHVIKVHEQRIKNAEKRQEETRQQNADLRGKLREEERQQKEQEHATKQAQLQLALKQRKDEQASEQREQERLRARIQAQAEYDEERRAAEDEAARNVERLLDAKRDRATEGQRMFEERREAGHSRVADDVEKIEMINAERMEQRREREKLVDQQQKERMMVPYRMHDKERARLAMAPVFVAQMDAARNAELTRKREDDDMKVEMLTREAMREHADWVNDQDHRRMKTRERIAISKQQQYQRQEQHAQDVQRYEAHVSTFQKHKERRAAKLRLVREELDLKHSQMLAGLYASDVGAEVTSTQALEQKAERSVSSSPRRRKIASL